MFVVHKVHSVSLSASEDGPCRGAYTFDLDDWEFSGSGAYTS